MTVCCSPCHISIIAVYVREHCVYSQLVDTLLHMTILHIL